MTDFKSCPVGHAQPKRHKRSVAKLFFDLCRSHDKIILPAGPARGNPEYLTPAPYRATASFCKARSSFKSVVGIPVNQPVSDT